MAITCPKCSYVRTPADSAPEWQCPACGIAYEKFKQAELSAGSNGASVKGPGHRNAASAPMLLCKRYMIAKSKLRQVGETKGVVLLSKDTIYFAKKGGMGALVALGGIYGGAIGGVVGGIASRMIDQHITKPGLKAAGAVSFEALPQDVQRYLTRLDYSGEVVVVPREAVKEMTVSRWRGTYFKTESHLYELRLGPLEFGSVKKKLAFYKWL